jgi:imidazoleglycerol-phosphate dehydratase
MGIFGKGSSAGRRTDYLRESKETRIELPLLNIDGTGETKISTSIGFLDHMLTLFSYHGYFDIELKAMGDQEVDNHHLNEDIGLALGEAFKKALDDCKGIVRTASAEVPMDRASAKVLVDLSNRPAYTSNAKDVFEKKQVSDEEGYSLHYAEDFLTSFANKMAMNLHVEIAGEGDMHHYLEAVFKALGIAMDKATRIDPRRAGKVPSSKGIL